MSTSDLSSVSNDSTDTVQDQLCSVSTLASHLIQLVSLLLEQDFGQAPQSLIELLDQRSVKDELYGFIANPLIKTLLVRRRLVKDEQNETRTQPTENETAKHVAYSISHGQVTFCAHETSSIILTKRTSYIRRDKAISNQITMMNINDPDIFGNLHSYISDAISPYFNSYVEETADRNKMTEIVEQKIVELEVSLFNLQQNINIPDVILQIHPIVLNVMKKCREENRKATVDDFEDKLEDSAFLNQLQTSVNKWIREIQKVTSLDYDLEKGTSLQEINFWLDLKCALKRIQLKLDSPEVALTLDILKKGKRFHAIVSLDADTGLKQAIEMVNDFSLLIKGFPINDLLLSTELGKIKTSMISIFQHLKKIRNTQYPIKRALLLIEAISRDLLTRLLQVLASKRIMYISFEEFEKLTSAACDLFITWDDKYDKLWPILLEIIKKKRVYYPKQVFYIYLAHKQLQRRIDEIYKLRRQHEKMRSIIVRVLCSAKKQTASKSTMNNSTIEIADMNAIEQVDQAYEAIKEIDTLDISREGSDAWCEVFNHYEEKMSRLEAHIATKLKDQLSTAQNANQMSRIFSRCNELLLRSNIRCAIRQPQTQIIGHLKNEIESLHVRFKQGYAASSARKMNRIRDISPVVGNIIWAKQIERKLNICLDRVERILGREWEQHIDGFELKTDASSFRMKLSTQLIFDEWACSAQQMQLNESDRILSIESCRTGKGCALKLKVNFKNEIITLPKDVRSLKNLSFKIPNVIVNKAHKVDALLPSVNTLFESVKSYESACEKLDECQSSTFPTIDDLKKKVETLFNKSSKLTWESCKLSSFVDCLGEAVTSFSQTVDELV